jgi:hypothetical protein
LPDHVGSEQTAIALTQRAQNIVSDAVSHAQRKRARTGNKQLDNALFQSPVPASPKINVVMLWKDDQALLNIAIKECLKRQRSVLVLATDRQADAALSSGFVWQVDTPTIRAGKNAAETADTAGSANASHYADTHNAAHLTRLNDGEWLAPLHGRMRYTPLQQWFRNIVEDDNNGAYAVPSLGRQRRLRVFVVAHSCVATGADGFVRRQLTAVTAESLAHYLHDMIIVPFAPDDGDGVAVNFVSCKLLGVGEAPGEAASYVGRFCRALHRHLNPQRVALDISASPYTLVYAPHSFIKRRQVDPFDPGYCVTRDALLATGGRNKMRWRASAQPAAELIDWQWQSDGAGDLRTTKPAGSDIPGVRARKTLNTYHYTQQGIDEQFVQCLEDANEIGTLDLMQRFALTKRQRSIDGTALFELYVWAAKQDAPTAHALLGRIAAHVAGPRVFPCASDIERRRYFSHDGRLRWSNRQWVSGMRIGATYHLARVDAPHIVADAMVPLARLAQAAIAKVRTDHDRLDHDLHDLAYAENDVYRPMSPHRSVS